MKKILIMAACSALILPVVNAEVYKYVDEKGNVTYSSIPPAQGAKPVKSLPPLSTYDGQSNRSAPAAKSETTAKPGEADGKRNADRRQYLQQQLTSERKALADAQKALAEGKTVRMGNERNYAKYQERIKGLEDAVKAHENKINDLQRQLNQ